MINQFLDKRMAALFQATLVGSGILCFLLPAAGFYKIAGLGLSQSQSLLGAGIVVGLTVQAMILSRWSALPKRFSSNAAGIVVQT